MSPASSDLLTGTLTPLVTSSSASPAPAVVAPVGVEPLGLGLPLVPLLLAFARGSDGAVAGLPRS